VVNFLHWLWEALGFRVEIGPANIVEFVIAQKLSEELNMPVHLMAGEFRPFDLSVMDCRDTWEIKFETNALSTKNFCFETSYRGNPSGITSTEARWWIHSMPSGRDREELICYEFSVPKLRNRLEGLPEYPAGQMHRSRVKLLPVLECEKLARRKFMVKIPWKTLQPYWY